VITHSEPENIRQKEIKPILMYYAGIPEKKHTHTNCQNIQAMLWVGGHQSVIVTLLVMGMFCIFF
jgi:hypothetical protein